MTHFRTFRNGDPPRLAALWNRAIPAHSAARPLSGHEFDTHVVSKPHFDAQGLCVAERDGRIVGFAHAGFGPEEPVGPPFRLGHAMGSVAMLAIDPDFDDPDLGRELIEASLHYLRRHGAEVIYAGGQYPLNPFYWGVYGGSEWAGILSTHTIFGRTAVQAGFKPVSTTVLLEADLSAPEPRDSRAFLIRRQAKVEIVEDALPRNWWEALAIGEFRPTRFRLLSKADDRELAHAVTWDMSWFGRGEGRTRVGLIDLEVDPEHRRKGFGRYLVAEILRHARDEPVDLVAVQTGATNTPALALYQSVGFDPVETAVLYRLPAEAATGAR